MTARSATVAVAITYVPGTRDRQLWANVTRLGGPGPGLFMAPDVERSGCWPTVRRAWLRLIFDSGADYGLVLADDMVPAPDLLAALPAMIDARPGVPIGLYTGRQRLVDLARASGSAWVETRDGWWGGSWAMPLALAAEWLEWCDRNVAPAYPHDDGRAGLWAVETDRWLSVAVPSPLQHGDPTGSVMGHGGMVRGRTAIDWLGDRSTLDVDWTAGADAPPRDRTVRFGPVSRRELNRIRGT